LLRKAAKCLFQEEERILKTKTEAVQTTLIQVSYDVQSPQAADHMLP
jgi:hypothetical protein